MKQRVISGVFIALITIAACLIGSYFLMAICAFIDIWGAKEVVDLRKDKKFSMPLFLTISLSSLLISFLGNARINVQLIVVLIEIIVLMSLAVFDEDIDMLDVGTSFIMSLILGFGSYFFMYFDNFSKYLFGYVIIISYLTDVFALFVGMKFGKHKLNERISPKKTIEGSIGGWILGGIVSFLFAWCFNFFFMDIKIIIIGSVFLPIVSMIGDLAFSMIKRYYDVKDYSNLIPGHGGLLDRLDSLLFTTLFLGAICILFI